MKIVQINAVYGEKSTGLVVKDISEELKENGIESYIGYQKSNSSVPNGIRIGNRLDWKLHAAFTRLTGLQGYVSSICTLKFLKELDRINPDVIHLHNIHANFINLKILLKYCAKNNIKTMLTLHDCFFFTGKCFHFFDIGCEKYKTGCKDCPKKMSDIPNYTLDMSKKVWNDKKTLFQNIKQLKVIGCSEWMRDLAASSEIFKNKKVVAIRNGVDTCVFKPRNSNFREMHNITDKFVILCMANKWFEVENKEITEKIVENLKDNERVVLVGCSKEQHLKLKQDNKVIAVGYISDRNELADIYSMADVFVNLSLIDNLPTVNMESICCGTPVICYKDCGGGPELIEEGVTGFVVGKKNYQQLQEKINEVKNKAIIPSLCAEIGKNSFSKQECYKKYINEYLNW